jgi:cytochrome c oxidase assembly protein subunit 15
MSLPRPLLLAATALAFTVVVLGAYVRLSDAGLGCPDWPGCYGQATPWHAKDHIDAALATDPEGPVSHAKAWKEMLHRYLAGGLGLVILAIAGLAWWRLPPARRVLPGAILVLVIFQALLGMWTVTEQLRPVVVVSHLLGGMSTLALLAWLAAEEGRARRVPAAAMPVGLARAALALLACQVALGGWVSANYAALACPDLPTCQGAWWPQADFALAFGVGHRLGELSAGALTAIHLAHRLGAVLVLASGLLLAWRLLRIPGLAVAGVGLLAAVSLQFLLGVANVAFSLPLPVAVGHNAGAALLLLVLVWINAALARSRP